MTGLTIFCLIVAAFVAVPIVLGILRILFGLALLACAWGIGGFSNWYERRQLAKMTAEERDDYHRAVAIRNSLEKIKTRWGIK